MELTLEIYFKMRLCVNLEMAKQLLLIHLFLIKLIIDR